MKYAYFLILSILLFAPKVAAQLTFEDLNSKAIAVTPSASSGLEGVYVIENASGVKISYQSALNVKWSRFSKAGAAYAEEIGEFQSLPVSSEDMGYIAEFNGRQHYFWIVNYANHQLQLNSLAVDGEFDDCGRVKLDIDGQGGQINYYSINGRGIEISRDITLKYTTLSYNADDNNYKQIVSEQNIEHLSASIYVEAPYCDTRFALSGDRFLQEWGLIQDVETEIYQTSAVTAETSAEQLRRDVDNEQSSNDSGLGGSAPCEITFEAIVTDAAYFCEWQLSRTSDFSVIDDRYQQTDFTYTFREQGTTYVRFFATDPTGKCQYVSSVYEVMIGESRLLCPNAFTPESSPGVNDEWKVSYKSIISFECHIFNRWGTELCSFTDPSLGWDGKYKGKYVPAGVYYYVIKATGADGKDYKLSGDINIIKAKNINTQNREE